MRVVLACPKLHERSRTRPKPRIGESAPMPGEKWLAAKGSPLLSSPFPTFTRPPSCPIRSPGRFFYPLPTDSPYLSPPSSSLIPWSSCSARRWGEVARAWSFTEAGTTIGPRDSRARLGWDRYFNLTGQSSGPAVSLNRGKPFRSYPIGELCPRSSRTSFSSFQIALVLVCVH